MIRSNSSSVSGQSESYRGIYVAGVLLVLAVAVIYANSLSGPFVLDDTAAIVENQTIRDFSRALKPPVDRGLAVSGRPLVNLSLAVNYAWGKIEPRSYHVVNIALHAATALLLFGLVRRTWERFDLAGGGRAAVMIGFGAALLWAVHPLQTAAVTYTIQRAEILVSLFYLLTLYGFARATAGEASAGDVSAVRLGNAVADTEDLKREGRPSTGAPWRQRAWLGLSVVACALGMTAKEIMVSAPVMVLLYDRTFGAGSFRTAIRQRWSYYAALAGTWLVLAALMAQTGGRAGTAGFGLGVSPWAYGLKQCEAVMHYLRLVFWPSPLVFDYGGFVLLERASDAVLPGALLFGLLAATAWALWKKPALGFAGVWWFALLAPTSSVVPLADTMFEHRPYLALAAVIAVMTAWLIWASARRALIGATVIVALAAALGVATVRRNTVYRSELTLWEDTVNKRPGSVRAHYTLGAVLFAAGRADEAVEHYRVALGLNPAAVEAHNNLGNALVRLGRVEEAVPHYEAALRLRPTAEGHNNLGNALVRLGRGAAAREQYERALRMAPELADAHNNLGNIFAQQGELAQAAMHYEKALSARPDLADAQANLGNVLAQSGRFAEAVPHYEAALRLRPGFADAHFNFALTLARLRRWAEAADQLETLVKLQPGYPRARQALEQVRALASQNGAAK